MALWHWLGGAISVSAVTIAGGSMYADQQLKKFYYSEPSNVESLINLKIKNFDMGTFNGQSEYSLTLNLDPCKPDQNYTFELKDKIHKGFTGYSIVSEVQIPKEWQTNIQKYFGEQSPLSMQTNISWLGNVQTTFSSPAINYQKDHVYIQSKGLSFTFETNEKDTHHLKNVILDIPSFIVRDDKNYFSIDGLHMTADQQHARKILPNAKSDLTINHIRVQTYLGQPIGFNLDQLKATNHTIVKGDKVNSLNTFVVDKLKVVDSDKQGKLVFNLDITDLDKATMQSFFDEMYFSNKECIEGTDQKKREDQAALKFFSQGFKFESKGNLFELNPNAQFKGSFSGELTKGNADSVESFTKNIPTNFQMSGEMETNKSFIREVMGLNKNTAAIADDQLLDMMIQQMISEGKVKKDGDKLISKFEYKYGNAKFLP